MCVDEAEALETGAKDEVGGRKLSEGVRGAEMRTATCGQTKSEDEALMERVVERENMSQAYRRVLRNKGAAGVDAMTTEDLGAWLKQHWPCVHEALLDGSYIPQSVRRADIPKPDGGVRTLGVPTVVGRCRRCYRTSCSRAWITTWKLEGWRSAGMPMTAIFAWAANGRANAS
ncbi:hypothetical protein [Allopusillimonas ginsengisoli]|uniref:hypothetical protein n=1 Tax=Allopusillimonas ginsengisoli TaxID=453575 RepID=UPI001FD646E1|nr:hypothetical protein [Allopusillimonas ginsengisoli]